MNVELFLILVAVIVIAELIVWFPMLGLLGIVAAVALFRYDGVNTGTLMAVLAIGWVLFAAARYSGSIWPRSDKTLSEVQ